MKLASFVLATALAVAGFAQAQTAPSSSPAPAAPPADKASSSGKVDHACKKEIHDLCGRAHGQGNDFFRAAFLAQLSGAGHCQSVTGDDRLLR